ncbi:hypothetical protein YC2023_077789 [Brassica napus]
MVIPVHVHAFTSALNLIDNVSWRATVTDVSAFSPILVREFLANLSEANSTVRIRNEVFQITSTVVNQTFDIPDGGDSEEWKLAYLDHSDSILPGGLRNQWNDFSVEDI